MLIGCGHASRAEKLGCWTIQKRAAIAAAMAAVSLSACSGEETTRAHDAQTEQALSGLRVLFDAMDTNGDGIVRRGEIGTSITLNDPRTGERLEGEAAAELFMELFDADGDGAINWSEASERLVEQIEALDP